MTTTLQKTILITGGLGFIGSHTIVELCKDSPDIDILIVDNLVNSKVSQLNRLKQLTNKDISLITGDIGDESLLNHIFQTNSIYAVIHFAAVKAVPESIEKPLLYYDNNVSSTITLLKVMEIYNVRKFIFSSSATVYGDQPSPLTEDVPIGRNLTNPYGKTKYMIEKILEDLKGWDNIIVLRYFNPVGAHPSGIIGENPNGIPNNLMPFILNVAKHQMELDLNTTNHDAYKHLKIYGNDYDTIDGTGVRDYIHVVDLAIAHVKALQHFEKDGGYKVYNIGTGNGTSVLELVQCFMKTNHLTLPYTFYDRRPGDVGVCFCCAENAKNELGWSATKTIEDMCRDAWNFVKTSPPSS